jgi:hypothetical protein
MCGCEHKWTSCMKQMPAHMYGEQGWNCRCAKKTDVDPEVNLSYKMSNVK